MTPPSNPAKPWHFPGLNLADNLRRELQLQQIAMSASIQWGVYPVIVMSVTGLWQQMAHLPLVLWSLLTALVTLLSVLNAHDNHRRLLTVAAAIPDFTKRNAFLYFMVGLAWGSLPVICALWGSEEANWFSMVIALAALASLALILSTTQVVFAATMVPAGLLILVGVVLGPLCRASNCSR